MGVLAHLACESTARASDSGLEWNTSADARVGWLRKLPDMGTGGSTETPLRSLPDATVPGAGSIGYAALSWDAGVVIDGRWVVPVVGLQFGWAIGASSAVAEGVDGSIVTSRPSSAAFLTLEIPGFGMRIKARRWMLAATLRPALTYAWMGATVANGAHGYDLSGSPNLSAGTFALRAEIEGCRRLDPVERVCLLVAPTLYEFAPVNGGSVGIRMEFGP